MLLTDRGCPDSLLKKKYLKIILFDFKEKNSQVDLKKKRYNLGPSWLCCSVYFQWYLGH